MRREFICPSTEDVFIALYMQGKVFESLSEREKTIILMRYIDECTYKEIGKNLGVSPERARQIDMHMLRKIRRILLFDLTPMETRVDNRISLHNF